MPFRTSPATFRVDMPVEIEGAYIGAGGYYGVKKQLEVEQYGGTALGEPTFELATTQADVDSGRSNAVGRYDVTALVHDGRITLF